MKYLFLGIVLGTGLYGFPPRNSETFVNNCLRLLNSRQYSFLTQYFEEYFPHFKDLDRYDYVEEIAVRVPYTDKKEIILKTYINHAIHVASFAYDLYGQIKFFEKDYREVIKAYQRYDQPERFYYLGWAEKELGNLIDARKWFLKAIDEIDNPSLKEQSYLGLAEISIRWENFTEARKFLRKVSNRNYQKSIMYYYLYRAEKNEKFLEKIIAKIKNFPQDDPIVEAFLKSENLD